MPRCPDYLQPDDFDKLASSIGIELSDEGVGAIGEIIEKIAIQIIKDASTLTTPGKKLDMKEILASAENKGVKIEVFKDPEDKLIKTAEL